MNQQAQSCSNQSYLLNLADKQGVGWGHDCSDRHRRGVRHCGRDVCLRRVALQQGRVESKQYIICNGKILCLPTFLEFFLASLVGLLLYTDIYYIISQWSSYFFVPRWVDGPFRQVSIHLFKLVQNLYCGKEFKQFRPLSCVPSSGRLKMRWPPFTVSDLGGENEDEHWKESGLRCSQKTPMIWIIEPCIFNASSYIGPKTVPK